MTWSASAERPQLGRNKRPNSVPEVRRDQDPQVYVSLVQKRKKNVEHDSHEGATAKPAAK